MKKTLPNEQFIYYGDTAHLPYGDKSEVALISYVESITAFLKSRNCKMVVVACNSATTVIHNAKNIPFTSAQIVEVISPIVDLISKQQKFENIGIIGTRKTINSGMFNEALKLRNPKLNVVAKATPLLVPLIEEGCELIVPACTHYPIIYKQIESYFNHSLKVLHTPKIIAETVEQYLKSNELLNLSETDKEDEFHLSDITPEFIKEAEMFLGNSVVFQKTLLN